MVLHYRLCLLVWCITIARMFVFCHSIDHACSCGTSLSAMHSGVVPHYIGRVGSGGTSLSAMPAGVVPYYKPCLLVLGYCSLHLILVKCKWKKNGYKSGPTLTGVPLHQTSADPVSLSDMPACTVKLCQTCMLGSFLQLHMFVKCCSIWQGIWSVTVPSDMHTGRVPLPHVCKMCRLLFL